MQPPVARAYHNRGLTLFVQPGRNRTPPLHAFAQKVIKTLARAPFGKIFVPHGDNIDRVKFDRNVEPLSDLADRTARQSAR